MPFRRSLAGNPDLYVITDEDSSEDEACVTDDDCTVDGEICCPVQLICEPPSDTNPLACGETD